jgi:hypothetical protein
MIVYGKTSVNTGTKGGVIVKLQCLIEKRGLLKPTYIVCQYYILDKVLRHVFDMNYPFVTNIVNNDDNLKHLFWKNDTTTYAEIAEKEGMRDDLKFLFHLTRVFRHYHK